MSDRRRHGFILLLVAGLIAASAVILTQYKTVLGLDLKGGVELVYQAQRTPQSNVNQNALNRAVDIMRQRVDQLGVAEPEIQTSGGNQISVALPNVKDTHRAEQEVGTTARLEFYDWEANVLLSNGQTVAEVLKTLPPGFEKNQSLLTAVQRQALASARAAARPAAARCPLYDAVKLASKQPAVSNAGCKQQHCARAGPSSSCSARPGSKACASAAHDRGNVAVPGERCLLEVQRAGQTNARALFAS